MEFDEQVTDHAWDTLQDHRGLANAINGLDLAEELFLRDTRYVRHLIRYLRFHLQKPILAQPGKGYYVAASSGETAKYIRQCRQMGIDYFLIQKVIRGINADQVAAQLVFDMFEPDEDLMRPEQLREHRIAISTDGQKSSWTDVLHHLIRRLRNEPVKYRDAIQQLNDDGIHFLSTAERQTIQQAQQLLSTVQV